MEKPITTLVATVLLPTHFTAIPPEAVIIAISRTGRSIEIVQLLAKAEASGAAVIGVTNSADSPLARESAVAT
jgi:DNA-binding MurR/RpiR family transcriptional regulator